MSLHRDQDLDRGAGWTPGREIGQVIIDDFAPDQQAAGPQPALLVAVFAGLEIGQFQILLVLPCHLAAPDGMASVE